MLCPLTIVVLLMTALSYSLVKSQSSCTGEKVPKVYRLTSVTTCPTGEDRTLKEQSCNSSNNVYHCLPDESGNLYVFCGESKKYLRYSYFVVDHNDTLHVNNLGFTISPGTETELYSNLSQVIINAPDSLDRFPIFEKLQEELNFTAIDACRENVKGYALPSRHSCNFINTCSRPRSVPCITIYIVNASNGHGSIIEREFPVPKTNEKKYALLALVLCRNYLSTLRKQCLELSVTQDHISSTTLTTMYSDDTLSTTQTTMYPEDTLSTDTTSQHLCDKNELQICQICNNTIHIIVIVIETLIIIIIIVIALARARKYHLIEKCLTRIHQSTKVEGGNVQPTDAHDTSHQSYVVPFID